jgi:hypothetical protein
MWRDQIELDYTSQPDSVPPVVSTCGGGNKHIPIALSFDISVGRSIKLSTTWTPVRLIVTIVFANIYVGL